MKGMCCPLILFHLAMIGSIKFDLLLVEINHFRTIKIATSEPWKNYRASHHAILDFEGIHKAKEVNSFSAVHIQS